MSFLSVLRRSNLYYALTVHFIARKLMLFLSAHLAGIQVLLTRSLFARDILRRSLLRVFPAKPTSAPLPF
jgi:hypothetical protein